MRNARNFAQKMTVKYITVKAPDRLTREPFYMGIPQHDRTLSRRSVGHVQAELFTGNEKRMRN